jgi:hypothetical protein
MACSEPPSCIQWDASGRMHGTGCTQRNATLQSPGAESAVFVLLVTSVCEPQLYATKTKMVIKYCQYS